MKQFAASPRVKWISILVLIGAVISAAIAQQFRFQPVQIYDPVLELRTAVSYLINRMDTLDRRLEQEVALRQALEKEVDELKKNKTITNGKTK